jgi:DNA-binding transcriptional LysR family regulator
VKISPYQIAALAAVGREKSFSNAALELGISQSAVTQHINALETEVGTKLLIRGRGGSELTSAGLEIYELADRIHVLEMQLEERILNLTSLETGKLRICVSTPRPAMAIISAFKQRYSGVEVEITVAPRQENLQLLKTREVDISIVAEPGKLSGLAYIEIERRPFVGIVPLSHRLARRKKITLSELTDETFVVSGQSSFTMWHVNKRFNELGFKPKNTLETSSYEMILEAVIHNIGVSIILDGSMSNMREVHRLSVEEFKGDFGFYAVTQDDKSSLIAVRAFFDIVEQGQRANQPWM